MSLSWLCACTRRCCGPCRLSFLLSRVLSSLSFLSRLPRAPLPCPPHHVFTHSPFAAGSRSSPAGGVAGDRETRPRIFPEISISAERACSTRPREHRWGEGRRAQPRRKSSRRGHEGGAWHPRTIGLRRRRRRSESPQIHDAAAGVRCGAALQGTFGTFRCCSPPGVCHRTGNGEGFVGSG